jgi:cytoskeletal protein CcmA (bactofilin family)
MVFKGFKARGQGAIETVAEAGTPHPVRAQSPAPRVVSPSTSIDAFSEFEGKLRCKESLRVDGNVQGEIDCEKMVLVGEGARVCASIGADEVQISGVVEGDIAARRKITLTRTAVVVGDLTTPGIVIEEGAKLKGRIVIGSDEDPAADSESAREAKKKAQASRHPTAASPKTGEASSSQPVVASA